MTKTRVRFTAFFITFAVLLACLPLLSTKTFADEPEGPIEIDGFKIVYWYDKPNVPASVTITGYTGTDTNLVLPTHVIINGVKAPVQIVGEGAFKGNKTITSLIVPNDYEVIGKEAFAGCTNLKEVTLGNGSTEGYYVDPNVFMDCPNLKTVYIGTQPESVYYLGSDIFGKMSDGSYVSDVNINLVAGSKFDEHLINENTERPSDKQLKLSYPANPAAKANITKVIPGSGDEQTGEDGTPYGKGASAAAVDKAITKWASENDPKGTVYNVLQAKLSKATKNSVKLSWKKVSGTKTYVVYGNQCGKKNKMTKLQTTSKTSLTFKKVLGKKLKKGTYYKFIVIALDANGKVVSSSKTVHAATKGGKVGNDKSVKTAAKKNKVSIKKGKTFKLKAKAVPESKKLKVKRHRALKYETTNSKVATVSAKGIIKGSGKGTCYVYAYAQNGVAAKIKVTVK